MASVIEVVQLGLGLGLGALLQEGWASSGRCGTAIRGVAVSHHLDRYRSPLVDQGPGGRREREDPPNSRPGRV